jgi:hypothetical protein
MYTKHGLGETRLGLWHGHILFHPPIETLFIACRGSLRVSRSLQVDTYELRPATDQQMHVRAALGSRIPPRLSGSHDSALFVDLSSGERRRCCWHDAAEVAVVWPR